MKKNKSEKKVLHFKTVVISCYFVLSGFPGFPAFQLSRLSSFPAFQLSSFPGFPAFLAFPVAFCWAATWILMPFYFVRSDPLYFLLNINLHILFCFVLFSLFCSITPHWHTSTLLYNTGTQHSITHQFYRHLILYIACMAH